MGNGQAMKTAKKYIGALWPGSLIMLVMVTGYFYYTAQTADLLVRISAAENSIELMKAELSNSQNTLILHAGAQRAIQPYLNTLFPSDRPDALISEIKKLAARNNARLADIKLDVPKFIEIRGRNESLSIVPFEISFTGGFLSLGKFLERLEKRPYLQEITEVGISIQNDTGSSLRMFMKGAFRFFSKEAVEELTADGN